jgi:hypothetical protein
MNGSTMDKESDLVRQMNGRGYYIIEQFGLTNMNLPLTYLYFVILIYCQTET